VVRRKKKTLTTGEKKTNDQVFSPVDGQDAGLKELRLTRELSLMWETRLYFGNGELMESETVVVGVQGKGRGKFAAGRVTSPRKPRGSRPTAPP